MGVRVGLGLSSFGSGFLDFWGGGFRTGGFRRVWASVFTASSVRSCG